MTNKAFFKFILTLNITIKSLFYYGFDRFSIKDSYAYPSVDREAPIISMFNSIPSTDESESFLDFQNSFK